MAKLLLLLILTAHFLSVCFCQVTMDVRYTVSTLISGVGVEGKLFQAKNGDLYFTDALNHNVCMFSQSSNVTNIIIGIGAAGLNADGQVGTMTRLNSPRGVDISPSGQLFFSDSNNHRIRTLLSNNTVTTIAGATGFSSPTDPNYFDNEIYFSDYGNKIIKKVNLNTKVISNVIGNGTLGFIDGNASKALLNSVWSMTMDSNNGDLYIADIGNFRIRKYVKLTNMVETIAGSSYGYRDGTIEDALMMAPYGVSIALNGDVIFTDIGNHVIRKISLSTKMVTTIAGTGLSGKSIEGVDATLSPLNSPFGVLINSEGVIYFSDYSNRLIRKLTPYCSDSNYQLVNGLSCKIKSCYGIPFNDTKVCNNGHGICLSESCQCQNYWTGPQCEYTTCFGMNSSDPAVCSGKGTCIGPNICRCESGYYGNNCNFFTCFGVTNSSLSCSSHGACIAPNICVCKNGFGGYDCSLPVCFTQLSDSSSVCSGHGSCISPDTCVCKSGYYGKECEHFTCFGERNASLTCSGHGSCIGVDTCSCMNGFFGRNCSLPTCNGLVSSDSKVCSGRGNCVGPNQCSCQVRGYSGNDCEILSDICVVLPSDLSCSSNLTVKDSKIVTVSNVTELDSKVIEFTSTNTISVSLPSSISQYLSGKDLSLTNSSVTLISSVSLSNEQDSKLVSPITSLSFFKSSSNSEIRVQNLINPILINFQINVTIPSIELLNITCMYFDENQKNWISDSSITTRIVNTNVILTHLDGNSTISIAVTCATTHLTSFGIIDQNYKKANKDSTLKNTDSSILQDNSVLIGAIVGSIGGFCVIATIIILFITIIILLLRQHKKR